MQLHTAEHENIMALFERDYRGHRLDREKNKAIWAKGHIYENGETNELFLAFRRGYSAARAIALQDTSN